jgi:hypothetical protein
VREKDVTLSGGEKVTVLQDEYFENVRVGFFFPPNTQIGHEDDGEGLLFILDFTSSPKECFQMSIFVIAFFMCLVGYVWVILSLLLAYQFSVGLTIAFLFFKLKICNFEQKITVSSSQCSYLKCK